MSVFSDYKVGALTEDEYKFLANREYVDEKEEGIEDNTQDNNKEDVFFIDEDTDPELYQELLDCISNYKQQALSWGDIYYALCKMIQSVMYDIEYDINNNMK